MSAITGSGEWQMGETKTYPIEAQQTQIESLQAIHAKDRLEINELWDKNAVLQAELTKMTDQANDWARQAKQNRRVIEQLDAELAALKERNQELVRIVWERSHDLLP
jgi:chromosome segregation ATPase